MVGFLWKCIILAPKICVHFYAKSTITIEKAHFIWVISPCSSWMKKQKPWNKRGQEENTREVINALEKGECASKHLLLCVLLLLENKEYLHIHYRPGIYSRIPSAVKGHYSCLEVCRSGPAIKTGFGSSLCFLLMSDRVPYMRPCHIQAQRQIWLPELSELWLWLRLAFLSHLL